MAALHLVEQGRLSLDSDVNQALASWKISPSATAPGAVVTLRELLSHTAGLTVHGFPGYAASAPIPTLVQILNGEKPANTDPIRLEATIMNDSNTDARHMIRDHAVSERLTSRRVVLLHYGRGKACAHIRDSTLNFGRERSLSPQHRGLIA
jgi:hypothetical protein